MDSPRSRESPSRTRRRGPPRSPGTPSSVNAAAAGLLAEDFAAQASPRSPRSPSMGWVDGLRPPSARGGLQHSLSTSSLSSTTSSAAGGGLSKAHLMRLALETRNRTMKDEEQREQQERRTERAQREREFISSVRSERLSGSGGCLAMQRGIEAQEAWHECNGRTGEQMRSHLSSLKHQAHSNENHRQAEAKQRAEDFRSGQQARTESARRVSAECAASTGAEVKGLIEQCKQAYRAQQVGAQRRNYQEGQESRSHRLAKIAQARSHWSEACDAMGNSTREDEARWRNERASSESQYIRRALGGKADAFASREGARSAREAHASKVREQTLAMKTDSQQRQTAAAQASRAEALRRRALHAKVKTGKQVSAEEAHAIVSAWIS